MKAITPTTTTSDGAERRVWIARPQNGLSSARNNTVCATYFNFVGMCTDDVWVLLVGRVCALR